MALLLGCALVGWSIGQGRYALPGLLLAALFGVVLIARDANIVYALVVMSFAWSQVMFLLALPSQLNYVVDLLVFLLLGAVLLRGVRKRELTIDGRLVPWLVYMVIVLVAGGVAFMSVQSLVGYVVFPVMYVALLNADLDSREEKAILWVLAAMVFAQIPVTIVQRVAAPGESWDRIGGTLGRAGTPFMGVVMAAAWTAVVAYVLVTGRKKPLLLLLLLLIPLALGEVKAGYVLAGAGTVGVAMGFLNAGRATDRQSAIGLGRMWIGVAAVGLPLLAALFVYAYVPWMIAPDPATSEYGLQFLRDPSAAIRYLSGFSSSGQAYRLEALRVVGSLHRQSGTLMLGEGLGVLSSSSVLGEGGYQSGVIASVLGWAPSAAKYFLETGVAGLILFVGTIAVILSRTTAVLRRADDTHSKFVALALLGITPVFVIGGFYTSAWQFNATAASFWILLALGTRLALRLPEGTG